MTHHRHPQTFESIINTEFIDNYAIIENVNFSLFCLSIYRKLLLKEKGETCKWYNAATFTCYNHTKMRATLSQIVSLLVDRLFFT